MQNSPDSTIAVFVPSMRGGGAEKIMARLTNSFVSRGYRVDLVLANAVGPVLKEVSGAVTIVNLKSSRVLFSTPGLIRYLREKRPKALLSAMTHANVVAYWARAMAKVSTRLIVSERSNVSNNIESLLLKRLMRYSYNRSDKVITVSQGVADDLMNNHSIDRSKIEVIYNPVVGEDDCQEESGGLLHRWFESQDIQVVISVGRLSKVKNYHVLMQACARLLSRRRVRLVILGEGELRSDLENYAVTLGMKEAILMPGYVADPRPWLRKSSVFVLASAWEGLPGALIQAMACGTPVVSTDCPSGPAEILEDGRWGRLVPVGDADALARAIEETLDDPDLPDVARRAADFGVDRAVDAYLRVLGFPRHVSD